MDGGAGCPFAGRNSVKRSFSTMEAQHHEDDTPAPAWWQPPHQHDDPFMPPVPARFAGDGLDYRRPVMAVQGAGVSGQADQNLQELLDQPFTEATEQAVADRMARATEERAAPAETIDLTGDGDSEEAPHAGTSRAADSTSSRAQRLPRFERNIIDIDSSDNEEEPPQTRNMPGNFTADDDDGESLFMPQLPQRNYPQDLAPIGPRRTISGLRRHGFVRQPSPAMPLDDVEVVGSRPISQVQSRRQTPNIMSGNRSITPFPGENNNATIDLTQDDDDDVVFTEMRTLPGVNADRPAIGGRGNGVRDSPELYGGHGLGRLAALMARTNRDLPDFVAFRDRFLAERQARAEDQLDAARRRTLDAQQRLNNLRDNLATQNEERMMNRRPARPPTLHRLTALPGADMEFGLAAFDLGLGMQRPPTPKYEPPAPAVEGFTRNPEEEEVVVCPNCGDELAMGDTEIKQQVWVVKPCGHAYCGDCAENRTRPGRPGSKGKGKGKMPDYLPLPPPFKQCVVDGCKKPVNKNTFIHVYMSS